MIGKSKPKCPGCGHELRPHCLQSHTCDLLACPECHSFGIPGHPQRWFQAMPVIGDQK